MTWFVLLVTNCCFYADDSVIVGSDKDPCVVYRRELSNDLQSCNHWLIDNQLCLHVGEAECILFGSHTAKTPVLNMQHQAGIKACGVNFRR